MQDDCQNYSRIGEESVGEEHLAYHRNFAEAGDRLGESMIGELGLNGNGAVQHEHAEEVGDAHAERGQRKTGDVLVRAERDREEAVDQTAERCCQKRGNQRKENAINSILTLCTMEVFPVKNRSPVPRKEVYP